MYFVSFIIHYSNNFSSQNQLIVELKIKIRFLLQPFGEGLVTIVVPQLRKGENSLLLWNVSNLTSPIYTFVGHTDVVLEFQWRHKNPDINMIGKKTSKTLLNFIQVFFLILIVLYFNCFRF